MVLSADDILDETAVASMSVIGVYITMCKPDFIALFLLLQTSKWLFPFSCSRIWKSDDLHWAPPH